MTFALEATAEQSDLQTVDGEDSEREIENCIAIRVESFVETGEEMWGEQGKVVRKEIYYSVSFESSVGGGGV